MKTKTTFLAGLASLLLLCPLAAQAQFSLDEIEASVGSLSDEMARVDALLSDADANKRLAAMDMLIKSGNLDYAKRAKEVGLASSDKQMQRRALTSIFDSGVPMRIDFPLTNVDEGETQVRRMVQSFDGSVREGDAYAQVLLSLGKFDTENSCWVYKNNSSICAIVPTGEHYVMPKTYGRTGAFRLNSSGVLEGDMTYYDGASFVFTIDLAE